jgi:hypothetical protein
MNRVYLPQHHQLGTISGRVFRGFPGIIITEGVRVSLDDGRSVIADASEIADAHNVSLFPARIAQLSRAMASGLAAVERMDDGPECA